MKKATAVGGGQRGARAAEPAVSVVSMDDVPASPLGRNASKYDDMYEQVCRLKAGQALQVQCSSQSNAAYIRTAMGKRAKKDGQFLSSSRSADQMTRYFWLEKA